jgi:7,8-dihydropterin-6-yl-methyl-4-(beta-D-ribofuranosyl)aminobenzene 5'-phosphate synthase
MKITVLVDNKADDDLVAEHGLSIWVETEAGRILFDTGQGNALPANAKALGIHLDQADTLVLSHGHYDHTGGIPHVLKQSKKIEVYCHPSVVLPRYSIREGIVKPINMPQDVRFILQTLRPSRVHWVSEMIALSEGIGLSGPVPRSTSYEDTGGPYYCDKTGHTADPIDDDLALWLRTGDGLVVIAGCCHAGLVNTLNHLRQVSGVPTIRAVIGGYHLLHASDHRIACTISALRSLAPRMLVPCHCTGDRAVHALEEAFGDLVQAGHAGMTLRF